MLAVAKQKGQRFRKQKKTHYQFFIFNLVHD